MRNVGRKLGFVLAACNHGTMIVNRFDYRMAEPGRGFGVGFQVLEAGAYDPRREWGLLPPYGEHFLAAMEAQVTP